MTKSEVMVKVSSFSEPSVDAEVIFKVAEELYEIEGFTKLSSEEQIRLIEDAFFPKEAGLRQELAKRVLRRGASKVPSEYDKMQAAAAGTIKKHYTPEQIKEVGNVRVIPGPPGTKTPRPPKKAA